MLNHVIKIGLYVCGILAAGCSGISEEKIKSVSTLSVGQNEYSRIYKIANDSIKIWTINNLGYYKYLENSMNGELDSLLCFNKEGNRFVSCLLKQQLLKEGESDDIDFFYGEKINNNWYFFQGANIFIPRYAYQKARNVPIPFEKLHQIALKEVYSGYLTGSGEINEAWFKEHFEGPGWGDFDHQQDIDWALHGKRFNNRKDFYEYLHLQNAVSIWETRDTTQPIKHLEKNKPVLP